MAQAGSSRRRRRSTRRIKKLKGRRRQRGGFVAGFPRMNSELLESYLKPGIIGDGVKNNLILEIVSNYLEGKETSIDLEEIQNNINFLQSYISSFEQVLKESTPLSSNSLKEATDVIKEVHKLLKAIKDHHEMEKYPAPNRKNY